MSPALPVVSAREVVRALEKVGFVQRASGEPRKTPERCWQTVIVRLRRELVRGALASILRQSGVSVGEFPDVLSTLRHRWPRPRRVGEKFRNGVKNAENR